MVDESMIRQKIDTYILPSLNPDLQPYVHGDELQHPLLSLEGGVYPCMHKRINKLYLYKTGKSKIDSFRNEWQSFFPHLSPFERNTRFLMQEFERTDFPRESPDYFQLIGQIWTDLECLGGSSSFLELMLGLDHRPLPSENVHHMMIPTEKAKLAELPEEFMVFRGHAEPLLNGLSWTTDIDVALQFGIGSPLKSVLSMGVAQKSEVIALIDRWDEDEILIPSRAVNSIQTFETFNDNQIRTWLKDFRSPAHLE